ncbi:hypothetical protein GA398_11860 [Bacteroides xylanisolvens]|uniref:Uncharacterized protein n=1 Tax=Bacteroides xylanisolvens TaxID=371601 RepID=A0A7J5PWC1_9BACE|nr:hypothetical protein GA398_11860 [Bacteroides xylanisolvens]
MSLCETGIFISCWVCCPFAGDCGKAWRKKIPERSEDDFFRSTSPQDRLAQSARQTAIFAARNENA